MGSGLGIVGLIGWSNYRLKGKNRELSRKNKEIESALFRGQSLERKRVASELHDNLNTKVTALRWNLQALDRSNMTPQNVKIYQRIFDFSGDIYTDVWITVTQDNQVLWLVVSDNGVGLPEETQKQGMGVPNLRARVEDLAGTLAESLQPVPYL